MIRDVSIVLRAAACLAGLQGIAHGALFISAKPRFGASEIAVIDAMKSNRFFPGHLGYWDFYFGYGLIAAAACVVEGVLLWLLARLAADVPAALRPIILVFAAANIAHALLLTRYFKFPIPIVFDLAIAGVLTWAWAMLAIAAKATSVP